MVWNFKNYVWGVGLLASTAICGCKKDAVQEPQAPALSSNSLTTEAAAASSSAGIPLKNMFGVNAYEWDFLQNPSDPSNVAQIYEPKMKAIQSFTQVRHYLDWGKIEPNQGGYTFNPSHAGSWNYDVMYQRMVQDTMLALVDLKTCPQWFLNEFYPAAVQDAEDVPAPYSANKSDPASYILQAKAAFQFAARYGSNASVDPSLVTVDQSVRWTADPPNQVKIGLNVVKYIECDNERDKWWKGPQAQQTAQEYAANMSAFYDGNKGKLGKGVGVKAADPNMKVVMGGLASADVQYVKDMIEWCRENRGYRADGSVDLCFDVINYHLYSNNGNILTKTNGTVGVAPELSQAGSIADGFVQLATSIQGHPEVWVTENGYDINQGSPQRAIPIGNKTALLTQGDWTVRSALLYIRHGVNRLFFYELFDDTPNGSVAYQTSGLINSDLSRRPAADYIVQLRSLMGNYTYSSTLNSDPLVDKFVSGSKKTIYALTIPDQKGRTGTYTLNLGLTTLSANIYTLKAGASSMTKTTVPVLLGKLTVQVSETPVFVQPN